MRVREHHCRNRRPNHLRREEKEGGDIKGHVRSWIQQQDLRLLPDGTRIQSIDKLRCDWLVGGATKKRANVEAGRGKRVCS